MNGTAIVTATLCNTKAYYNLAIIHLCIRIIEPVPWSSLGKKEHDCSTNDNMQCMCLVQSSNSVLLRIRYSIDVQSYMQHKVVTVINVYSTDPTPCFERLQSQSHKDASLHGRS